MSLPQNIGAYPDCVELLEKAMLDRRGIRIKIGPEKSAFILKSRINQARVLLREETRRIYPKDDPRWNKTEYDALRITSAEDIEGNWWVYLERYGADILAIEPLSEDDHDQQSV